MGLPHSRTVGGKAWMSLGGLTVLEHQFCVQVCTNLSGAETLLNALGVEDQKALGTLVAVSKERVHRLGAKSARLVFRHFGRPRQFVNLTQTGTDCWG